MKKWKSIRLMCLIGAVLLQMENMDALAAEPGGSDPGWICLDGKWYWQKADMTAATGWLSAGGRTYYLREDGVMATGFSKRVGNEWYYFHEDGGMNLGDLELDNAVYTFSAEGALTGASWKENTGGGAYFAGCYDTQEQILFEYLCDEKRDQYFDARPDREHEYDGDMHTSYDRYAGLKMDVKLNRIAAAALRRPWKMGMQMGKTALIRSFIYEIVRMGKLLLIKSWMCWKNSTAEEKLIRIRWIIIGIWVWTIMRRTDVTGLWWY